MTVWSAHLSTLFTEHPVLRRPAAAAAAGFTAVETWWPPAGDPDAWVEAVRAAGVRAVLVNADGGDLAAGERGFCNHPGRAGEVLDAVRAAVRVAVACGGGATNLLVGRDDGVRPPDAQRAAAREVVRAAGDAAAALGGRVVIEHLNPHDVDRPLLATPAEALAFVEAVDHPAVRVLFDAYHARRAGLDVLAELRRVAPLLGHVQYADSPGRGAPGTGEVDVWALAEALDRLGYTGPIGLEYLPGGDTAAGLAWMRGRPGG